MIIVTLVLSFVLLFTTAYLFFRWSWKALPMFIPVIIFPIFSGEISQLTGFMVPVFLGAAGGTVFRLGRSVQIFIVSASLCLTVFASGMYYYQKNFRSFDELVFARNTVLTTLAESKKYIVSRPGSSEQKEEAAGWIDQQVELLKNEQYFSIIAGLSPVLRFFYYLIVSFMAYGALLIFFRKISKKENLREIPGLEAFQLNEYSVFVLIAGIAAVLLIDSEKHVFQYYTALNITLITAALYAVQGIGLVKYFLLKRGLPVQLLFIFLVVITFIPEILVFNLILLAGLGSLDLWADFRKRGGSDVPKNKKTDSGGNA